MLIKMVSISHALSTQPLLWERHTSSTRSTRLTLRRGISWMIRPYKTCARRAITQPATTQPSMISLRFSSVWSVAKSCKKRRRRLSFWGDQWRVKAPAIVTSIHKPSPSQCSAMPLPRPNPARKTSSGANQVRSWTMVATQPCESVIHSAIGRTNCRSKWCAQGRPRSSLRVLTCALRWTAIGLSSRKSTASITSRRKLRKRFD